jgi:N-acetylglucosamine-6-phosphate deacetylase
MDTLLRASTVITPDEELRPAWVLVRDAKIEGVGGGTGPDTPASIDLGELTLVSGFVDIHVHGGGGFSLMTADPEEVRAYARWAVQHGVTSFLATVCADDVDAVMPMLSCLAAVADIAGAELLGINLEGPFVSPQRSGALPSGWARPPDVGMFGKLLQASNGRLRVITIAPELSGAEQIISAAREAGVVVSVGHTDSMFEQAEAAFCAGATHVTHAYNAMRPFHHRDPGVIGAALETPQVTLEVIADAVHLHRATVSMLVRAFGSHRVALVTDGVAPAGVPGGRFRLGSAEAVERDGRIELPDGTIAGSAATMDSIVQNVVGSNLATLPEAMRMAATVPAAVASAGDGKGRIAPGYDADLVALTGDLSVAATWVKGRLVHGSSSVSAGA